MNTRKLRNPRTFDQSIPFELSIPKLRFNARAPLSPLFGVMLATLISFLPRWFDAPEVSAWAAVSLLMGFVYLALLPDCKRGWSSVLMGFASIAFALVYQADLTALHLLVSIQTVLAGLWMLRAEKHIELTVAGLILGLNAGASFLMMH